ncbi:hypothetical protein EB796_000813 [Bugula neritina]|uniref:Uncharacterized protein n=1 Tax=Bugula neritina TaxID=10212 RepID=A0A7J7KRR0_BUGNE|nr:hypothetical protein EB796_000813 [Bugula neritina]
MLKIAGPTYKVSYTRPQLILLDIQRRLDPDRYRASCDTIQPILEKKRAAMLKMKSRLSRASLAEYRAARALAQKTFCESVKVFWDSLFFHIEIAGDPANSKESFTAIKTATGPSTQTCSILKDKNDSVIKDNSQKLNRWVEHYSELYGAAGIADHNYINKIPDLPVLEHLDRSPDLFEIITVFQNLRSGKTSGSDEISVELLKCGLGPLAKHLHCWMNKCWLSQSVPQGFIDVKITALYKNKAKVVTANCISLSVTGKVFDKILLKCLQQVADTIYPKSQYGF